MAAKNPAIQPNNQHKLVNADGTADKVWLDYWAALATNLGQSDLAAIVAELERRIAELENGQSLNFRILGQQSVEVNGTVQPNGVVVISLIGDSDSPGNTAYYGTGPDGTKGWFPVASTILAANGELTKTVGPDGVTTLGLADVADSATGVLLAFTRDAKGRVSGTKSVTITGTNQQINVINGNASGGQPTISLAAEVLAALAEALTALQPSDVTGPNSVKVTSNGSGGIVLNLDNDLASPAALTNYSVNSAGARGWHRPALFESTGVINGGALSINAGNNARFDLAQAVIGYTDWSITPSQPTRVLLTVGPFTAQVVTNIATANATYVGIQMPAGTIVQQTSPFSNAQRRTIAQIGVLVHSNNTTINAVNDQAATVRAVGNQLGDLMMAIGAMNLIGNIYSANGANLNINKSAGSIFKMGANFQASNLDPHTVSIGAQTALTFRYRLSNGVEGADTTNINPNQYESAPGVLSNIPILGNQWHVQRISLFQSGLTRIQYGQQLYGSLAAAIQGITTDSFNTEQNIGENGVLRCYLVINRGLLGLLGSATFVNVSKFGATQAGGGVVPVHNDLTGLQGGSATERYHLSAAQAAAVDSAVQSADHIDGMFLEYVSGTSFTVSRGSAYIESLGRTVAVTSPITVSGVSLSPGTYGYAYLYLNAGVPAVEFVSTAPSAPYGGRARSKTGDTSRRYIGALKMLAAGGLANFYHDATGMICWLEDSATLFRALNGGVATTSTPFSVAIGVPPVSRTAKVNATNLSTDVTARLSNPTASTTNMQGIRPGNGFSLTIPTDSSQQLSYVYSVPPSGAGFFIDVIGYGLER